MTARSHELVYLFPGQGAQRIGMAAAFTRTSRVAADLTARAEAHIDWPLLRLMFDGPMAQLSRTDHLQVALCVAEAACLGAAQEAGLPAPAVVAGHSLGELTACYAAGAFGYETLLDLAVARGRAMHAAAERRPGSMIALSDASPETIDAIVASATRRAGLVVANRNAPIETVLSGSLDAVLEAETEARRRGVRATLLKVSGPWHSPAMDAAAQAFSATLDGVLIGDPAVAVISGLDGQAVLDGTSLRRRLALQVNSAVRWDLVMEALMTTRPDATLIEFGPGKTLVGLALRNDRRARVRHIEDPATLTATMAALGLPTPS